MNGTESGFSLLPATSTKICFDKSEFMRDDYKVEQFVSDCRRRVPLEKLRDDLEQYFRLLKTAMVDLINKDYAEFVNLSTNLADLDAAISQLKPPLIKIKGDVELIETEINTGLENVKNLLEKKRKILEKKLVLKHLMGLHENLIFLEQNDTNDLDKTSEVWNMLQHHYKHTSSEINVQSLQHRISSCEQRIMESLENQLINALGEENNDMIHSVLSAYSSMSKCEVAEEIIRQNLCRPVIKQILEGQSVENLAQILNSLLDFVPTYLKTIQQIITGKYMKLPAISGFDFITRSIFPEMVSGLQTYLTGVFLPGENEEDFRHRYELSLDFLNTLELQCSSQQSVGRLRNSQSYHTFQNSFSLNDYFKKASQKLITQLESSLTYDLKRTKSTAEPRLESTVTLISILEKCNSDQVLLPGLLHRFYKLQIQIVYRYAKWASSVMSYASSSPEIFEQINYLNLVHLCNDIMYLSKILNDKIFGELIKRVSVFEPMANQAGLLEASNRFVQKRLEEPTSIIAKHVQSHLIERSIDNIKSVSDIPRQYRRTNRPEPTEPSQYVITLIKPSNEFHENTGDPSNWIEIIFSSITNEYSRIISEVLEATRKMEASLLKLKQMRKAKTEEKNNKMSDDEKIRLQIRLDVQFFGEKFIELGIKPDNKCYLELIELANSN